MRDHLATTRRLLAAVALAAALAGTTSSCGTGSPASAGTTDPHVAMDRALHDKLPESVRDAGVLRIGTDASYAPMSSFGPDGRTIVGVEPDLGAALGEVLGVKVQFVQTTFTDLIGKVSRGDLDLAMSAMTDTPERARKVHFVDYFSAGTAILVQRGNPSGVTDIKDLCGEDVAVERGTTQVDLLQRTQAKCDGVPIRVRKYHTNSDALVQLRTGRVVAVLNDLPPAALLASDPRSKAHYQLASTTQYEPGLYGIVVARDQDSLRDAVQGACEQLLRNGVYAKTLSRWGVQAGAVDTVTIDSGR